MKRVERRESQLHEGLGAGFDTGVDPDVHRGAIDPESGCQPAILARVGVVFDQMGRGANEGDLASLGTGEEGRNRCCLGPHARLSLVVERPLEQMSK